MSSENGKVVLKWYDPRRLGLTGEYWAGIIAGFGIGIVFMASVPNQYLIDPAWLLAGLVLTSIGGFIAHESKTEKSMNMKIKLNFRNKWGLQDPGKIGILETGV